MQLKKIAALSLILSISIGASVHAATSLPSTEKVENLPKKTECKDQSLKIKEHGGLFRTAEKLGISSEEFKEAKETEKNFFELAKQKGYSEQQVRDMIINDRIEFVDKAVQEGRLTKEKGEEIKNNIKERITKWDGKLIPHKKIREKNDGR